MWCLWHVTWSCDHLLMMWKHENTQTESHGAHQRCLSCQIRWQHVILVHLTDMKPLSTWQNSCTLVWEWALLTISPQCATVLGQCYYQVSTMVSSDFCVPSLSKWTIYWCTYVYNVLQVVGNIIYLCNGHIMHNKKNMCVHRIMQRAVDISKI